MLELIQYHKYSRKDIHDLFSPNTNFRAGTGVWGLQGIIKVPDTISDYIFLVTYGQSQSGHEFDESIDENGILTWQSQPQQTLNDKKIKDFITHDYMKSNIYLFLRTSKKEDYSYLGKLAYISHDTQREKPVYFKWQILDWDFDKGINVINNKEVIKKDSINVEDIDVT